MCRRRSWLEMWLKLACTSAVKAGGIWRKRKHRAFGEEACLSACVAKASVVSGVAG